MADSSLSTTAKALLVVFILAFLILFAGSVFYHFVYSKRDKRRREALKVHSLLPSPYDSRPMAQHRSQASRSLMHNANASRSANSVAAPHGPNTTQMWEAAVNGSRLQGGRIHRGTQLVGLSLGRRESQISEVLPVYSPPARGPSREEVELPGYEEVMREQPLNGRGAAARHYGADEEGLGFAVGQGR